MERFINNSFGVDNFFDMDFGSCENTLILVINAYKPFIALLNADGLNEDEKEKLVKDYLAMTTRGSIYNYSVARKIGNTYFCN